GRRDRTVVGQPGLHGPSRVGSALARTHETSCDGIYAPRRAGRSNRRGARRGAGADIMPAPDHVDAWCTRCGRRSQRSPSPHPKLTTAHDPGPRTDRRCRSADAVLRTTSLCAAGLDVTSVCDLVALSATRAIGSLLVVRPTEDD